MYYLSIFIITNRLDEYLQEGICKPCEEICGVEITQLCQTECKGKRFATFGCLTRVYF